MHADDKPIGRVLSRREVLALLGAAGAAALAACATPTAAPTATSLPATSASAATSTVGATVAPTVTVPVFETAPAATDVPATAAATESTVALPACIVRPAQTEGPYFVDEMLNRSDIRSDPSGAAADRAGVPLVLTLRVAQLNGSTCTPLEGAQVDIWHCDAEGVYSDVGSASGEKFLRGYQVTDADGLVTFTTIYPGWYQGRTAHIHFKIRTDPAAAQGTEFTSQLYFDETLNDTVYALAPYNTRGTRTTRNADDGVYQNGGDQLLLALTTIEEGYAATFDIGLQLG